MLSIFSYACLPSACPLWKTVHRSPANFLIKLFVFFNVKLYELFIYFRY